MAVDADTGTTPSIRWADGAICPAERAAGHRQVHLVGALRRSESRTVNLDVDTLHHLIGGWLDEGTDTWPVVWSLVPPLWYVHARRGNIPAGFPTPYRPVTLGG